MRVSGSSTIGVVAMMAATMPALCGFERPLHTGHAERLAASAFAKTHGQMRAHLSREICSVSPAKTGRARARNAI